MAITKEQIIALIDAKIAGQGSAVDIGGALPAILKGLADMGISSDMSETEQMQARKDLGLYYEETTTEEKTAQYTDEQTGMVVTKISDDVPTKEDIIGVTNNEGTPFDFEIDENETYIEVISTSSSSPVFAVVYEAGVGFFSEPGIYIYTDKIGNKLIYRYSTEVVSKVPEKFLPEQRGNDPDAVHFTQQSLTDTQKNQARKNLGLYYEETTTEERTVQYTDEVHTDTDPANYAKISDDTPSKDDIISIGGNAVQFEDEDDGYSCYVEGAPSWTAYYIVLNDSFGHVPGIYYSPNGAQYASMNALTYIGAVTTISKIPERFLPEQEGALPWLDLTGGYDIPQDGEDQNLSSMISQEDWIKLLAGEYAGIHTPENSPLLISNRYRPILMCQSRSTRPFKAVFLSDSTLGGYADNVITNRIMLIAGNSINSVSIRRITIPMGDIPGPVTLSALPEATMTTQAELDAIGLTDTIIGGIINGNYTGIKFTDTSVLTNIKTAFAQFKTAQRVGGTAADTTLVFDMLGNNYNILVHSVVGNPPTVTVTVTPLT